ncbi:hypothetical protein [Candidatus Flexifilum breve]
MAGGRSKRALHLKQRDGAVWASVPLAEIDNITVLVHFLRARITQ